VTLNAVDSKENDTKKKEGGEYQSYFKEKPSGDMEGGPNRVKRGATRRADPQNHGRMERDWKSTNSIHLWEKSHQHWLLAARGEFSMSAKKRIAAQRAGVYRHPS